MREWNLKTLSLQHQELSALVENIANITVLGGISTKGMTLAEKAGNPAPRITEIKSGMINCVGLQNPGVDYFLKEHLPWLKTVDTKVIANVAGSTIEDYIKMCEKVSVDGVDMVELNISCPNVHAGGASLGVDPQNVEKVTRAVRDVCKKPLMVKLTPNVARITDNAKAVEAGGADSVSLINTLSGMVVTIKQGVLFCQTIMEEFQDLFANP